MLTVISFDVSEDKRRYRVVRALMAVSCRVQKSVFEAANLETAAYLRLRSRAEREIDPATDSLRYHRLCSACAARTEHFGAGPGPLDPDQPFRIIGGLGTWSLKNEEGLLGRTSARSLHIWQAFAEKQVATRRRSALAPTG